MCACKPKCAGQVIVCVVRACERMHVLFASAASLMYAKTRGAYGNLSCLCVCACVRARIFANARMPCSKELLLPQGVRSFGECVNARTRTNMRARARARTHTHTHTHTTAHARPHARAHALTRTLSLFLSFSLFSRTHPHSLSPPPTLCALLFLRYYLVRAQGAPGTKK